MHIDWLHIDWLQIIGRAAVGAVIGGLIVLAVLGTRRLLGGDRLPAGAWLRQRRWLAVLVVVILAVAYAGFGYHSPPAPSPAPEQAAAPQAPAAPAAGPELSSAPVQIDVGGVAIAFAPPEGYCFYPAPQMQAVLAVQKKINPDNAVHTVFGDCDELRGTTGPSARIRDFGLLMTPQNALKRKLDSSVLDEIAREALDSAQIKQTADERIRAAQRDLQMKSYSSIGALEKDSDALYLGALSKVQAGDASFDQASITALTVIRGKLMSFYLYSDYRQDPHPVLDRLLATAKKEIASFAVLNR